MRTLSEQPTRQHGPVVVRGGRPDAPTLLVFDPAGEAKHAELPALWRPLSEHFSMVWVRVPAEARSAQPLGRVLDEVVLGSEQIHLVAEAQAVEQALAFAVAHIHRVHSVLLVDPMETDMTVADTERAGREARLRRTLETRGVRVRHTARDPSDPAQHGESPIPLGHPEVVRWVGDRLDPFAPPVEPTGNSDWSVARRSVSETVREALDRHVSAPLHRARTPHHD